MNRVPPYCLYRNDSKQLLPLILVMVAIALCALWLLPKRAETSAGAPNPFDTDEFKIGSDGVYTNSDASPLAIRSTAGSAGGEASTVPAHKRPRSRKKASGRVA